MAQAGSRGGASRPPLTARGLFPSTRWSRVLAAQRDPQLVREVLEELVRPRWKALYVLARERLGPADAEDAVQSFLERLASNPEQGFVLRLDPQQGSLRGYLKTAFRRHLLNLAENRRALKRGAGARHADLAELEERLESADRTPEQHFEQAWAASIFAEAFAALEAEFTAGARSGPFELVRELLAFGSTETYATLAERHGLSVPQLKALVHRTRLRFAALLRERVSRTLGDGEDVELELERLLGDLSR